MPVLCLITKFCGEMASGRLSYRPVKFAVLCHWWLILPVYSSSKSMGKREEKRGNRKEDKGLRCY